jgi:triosephosphate isomerase
MAVESINIIRDELETLSNEAVASTARVLYGGSVTADNFGDFMRQPEIDGGLVGGASLDPDAFIEMVRIAARRD